MDPAARSAGGGAPSALASAPPSAAALTAQPGSSGGHTPVPVGSSGGAVQPLVSSHSATAAAPVQDSSSAAGVGALASLRPPPAPVDEGEPFYPTAGGLTPREYSESMGGGAGTGAAAAAAGGGGGVNAIPYTRGPPVQLPPQPPGVLFSSLSQYSLGDKGKSACTAIALCAAATLLPLLDANIQPPTPELLTHCVMQGMQAMHTLGTAHTSCLEVWQANPQLAASLTAFNIGAENMGSLTDDTGLEELCAQAWRGGGVDGGRHLAIVLTKPPESVCLLLPPPGSGEQGRYRLLDSHPRPSRENAHMATVGTLAELLALVRQVFPAFRVAQGDEPWDEGELFMYNAFEGSFFQAK